MRESYCYNEGESVETATTGRVEWSGVSTIMQVRCVSQGNIQDPACGNSVQFMCKAISGSCLESGDGRVPKRVRPLSCCLLYHFSMIYAVHSWPSLIAEQHALMGSGRQRCIECCLRRGCPMTDTRPKED